MNSTSEADDYFSEQYTPVLERSLTAHFGEEVKRKGTFVSDFISKSGKTIEVKIRRRWYYDLLVEILNTYLDNGEQYQGWYFLQLVSDYFVYCVPKENICFILTCEDMKKIDLNGRAFYLSRSMKKGRLHLTENLSIPMPEVRKLPSFREVDLLW